MSTTDPFDQPDIPLNPYAAPRADLEAPPPIIFEDDQAQCEAIRRAHLGRETWIKLLGSFHYLGAVFGFIGVGLLIALALGDRLRLDPRIIAVIIAAYGALTVLNAALGYGLRALQSWARWTEAVLYGIGMAGGCLVVLAGLLVGNTRMVLIYTVTLSFQGAVLYLLLSHRGSVVFSSRYKEVIARTPHVRYLPGALFKLAVIVLVTIVAVTMMLALALAPD